MRLDFADWTKGPILPVPDKAGTWCSRSTSTSEASKWLVEILQAGPGNPDGISSHSLKCNNPFLVSQSRIGPTPPTDCRDECDPSPQQEDAGCAEGEALSSNAESSSSTESSDSNSSENERVHWFRLGAADPSIQSDSWGRGHFLLARLLSVRYAPVSERAKACKKQREATNRKKTKQKQPKTTNKHTTQTKNHSQASSFAAGETGETGETKTTPSK